MTRDTRPGLIDRDGFEAILDDLREEGLLSADEVEWLSRDDVTGVPALRLVEPDRTSAEPRA